MGTCMTLSSWATSSIEETAAAAPDGKRWFQLYVYKNRDVTLNLVRRAEKAGFKALAVTVDTPVLGQRLNDTRNGFYLPSHLKLRNYDEDDQHATGVKTSNSKESGLAAYVRGLIDPTLNWEHIDWLKSVTKLPIVLKGILTKESASEALNHGINGIIVSNHGARQLDGVPATVMTSLK